jgi:large subunit ribosomal protein L4
MQLDTYDLDGEKVGTVEIQNTLIEEEYSLRILQEAIVAYRNEIRQGTHSTLQRSEISGSTRKLWRQKGTGRARVGSVKNPIWRHGPVVFGPQPRDHGAKINQKARRKAVRVALSERVRQEQLSVLEKLELPTHKTKAFNSILCKFTPILVLLKVPWAGSRLCHWSKAWAPPSTPSVISLHFKGTQEREGSTHLLYRCGLCRRTHHGGDR